ncbi:hypothetical protein, partial [Streptomyces sp. NPDC001076]
MRRTVRTLSVAVLAGAAFGATGTAVAAAGPAAEISPGKARPGAVVTVSVTCAKAGGQAPAAIDATSSAFAGRTVRLVRVGQGSGLVYRGTARVVSGERPEGYTEGDAAAGDVAGDTAGTGPDGTWTVDGSCPAAGGQQGRPWSAHLALARGDGGTAPVGDGGPVLQGGGALPEVGGGAVPGTGGGAVPGVGGGAVPEVGGGAVPGTGGGGVPKMDGGTVVGGDDGTASGGDDGMFARGDEGTVPGG